MTPIINKIKPSQRDEHSLNPQSSILNPFLMAHFSMLRFVSERFFRPLCLLCLEKTRGADICPHCKKDLPFIRTACSSCGREIAYDAKVCGDCLAHPPPFDHTHALFLYEPPISNFILQLKFNRQLLYARVLGEWLAESLSGESRPDCMIPVPLHARRLRERGFNQALEIARPIEKKLGIPINISACRRIRHTEAQAELPENERIRNVKNAFVLDPSFRANHVVILDDVVTTGNTVSEIARLFKRQCVSRVDIWCVAKT